MVNKLSKKQSIVFSEINSFIKQTGFAPTFSELKKRLTEQGLKLKSPNSITQYLNVLESKGYLKKNSQKRGIKLLRKNITDFVEIPFLGLADCGQPLSFADDYIEEYITISSKYLEEGFDYFFVRATGNSMNKDKINDGDYVLVKRFRGTPENGENVIASVNGLGTIKKFKKTEKTVVLAPNSTESRHQPIIFHPDDQAHICGKVDKVFSFADGKEEKVK